MAAPPSFSIIVPTHRRRDTVCAALAAIGRIAYSGSCEVLVVVDGPDDGTVAALATVPCAWPLRVIEQPHRGAGAARNRGAAAAKGDMLLFLDDDMICEPDILDHHAASLAGGADAVLGSVPLDPETPPGFLGDGIASWAEQARQETLGESPQTPFQVFSGHLAIRRAVFEKVGGFDETLTRPGRFANEDADLGVRLLASYRVTYNPRAVSRHRYVVSPAENMQKALRAGAADTAFAAKHPSLAADLFALNRAQSRAARWLYRPLALVPGLAPLLAALAVFLAEALAQTRWRSSRWLARIFYGARSAAYWWAVRRSGGLPRPASVLVLCYHAFGDLRDDALLAQYAVRPEDFARQIDALERRGFHFLHPGAFLEAVREGRPLPRRTVLVTFDDCYADLLAVARDVLAPRGIRALAFAVGGMATGTNEWDADQGATRLPLLGEEGLRAIEKMGIEIGCHSLSHRPLTGMPGAELEAEIAGSVASLERWGLRPPRFFAYPFGAHDAAARAAVEAAGLAAAFTTFPGWAEPDSPPFALPRVEIHARDRRWRFALKIRWPWLARVLR